MLILFIKIKNHCQYGLHLIDSGNLPRRWMNLKHSSGGRFRFCLRHLPEGEYKSR